MIVKERKELPNKKKNGNVCTASTFVNCWLSRGNLIAFYFFILFYFFLGQFFLESTFNSLLHNSRQRRCLGSQEGIQVNQEYLTKRNILKSWMVQEYLRGKELDFLGDNLSAMFKVSHFCPQTLRLNVKYLQKSPEQITSLGCVF